jgi:LytS/YehU family sensor histidine kinase
MIQYLSRFLRHSLEQDGIEDVSLEQELDSLMLYLNIEKARFQDRLQLEFDIDPRAREALVPSLILQPIVENSMKYAIDPSEDGGSVTVSASVEGDQLYLSVADTGPGIDDLNKDVGRGIGLRNTLERLRALYDESYSFNATNRAPSGLEVRIGLPYRVDSRRQPNREIA